MLATAPRVARFVFDDQVRPGPGIRAVRNGGGSVLARPARAQREQLVVPLRSSLPAGDYTIRWRAISDDGHELAGVVAFGVGSGRAPPVPDLSPGSTGPGAPSILARWLFFLGLLAAGGIAVFNAVIWRLGLGEAGLSDADLSAAGGRERRAGASVLAGCLAVSLAGALLLLVLTSDPLDTRFGRVVLGGAILAAIGALAASLSVRVPAVRPLSFVAALAMLPLPTLAGHALDAGRSRLDLVVDVAHVTAASVWLGGLVSLAVLAPRAAAGLEAGAGRMLLRSLVHRFSTLALAAVALLVATGVWRAVAELDAVSQLWTTGYGRTILVKSALLLLIIALAVRNRYFLLDGAFSRLRLGVAGESLLLLGVVAAVALLTDLPPGRIASAAEPVAPPPSAARRPPASPPRGALVLARQDGRLAVGLAAKPVGGDRLRLTATVVGPDNTGVDGLRVSFRVAGTEASASGSGSPCGPGCYALSDTSVGRPLRAEVILSGPGRSTSTVEFEFPRRWPAPRADTLLDRATTAFRALRSVSYVERLSSAPGIKVVSRWKLEAPDRLEYAIPGGPAGIVIGTRRWDRTPGEGWKRSATQLLRLPAPAWGPSSSDAHSLGATTVGGRPVEVVTMLDRSLPAWFRISFDRKTLLPLSLDMVAAAHFMHHRYTSFDHAPRIRPPREK